MNRDLWSANAYDYILPEDLIAQNPVEPRDHSRLLHHDKESGALSHHKFYDLPNLLRPGDLLVMNDTRVLPARLFGHKESTGARVEILFLQAVPDNPHIWHALVRPGKKFPQGASVQLTNGTRIEIGSHLPDGVRTVIFNTSDNPTELIAQLGAMPLPPYIFNNTAPAERYQTVYSDHQKQKSAAAPTAGLHFTKSLIEQLHNLNISTAYITLNVGLGTFRPIKTEDIRKHPMHEETCEISPDTAQKIMTTRQQGGRIIAVGTTTVRTLESFANINGALESGTRATDIFIYPGYRFKIIDGMITNFHLPRSTLIMLVAAFGDYATTMRAYQKAVEYRYRFFSFGDAMLIL